MDFIQEQQELIIEEDDLEEEPLLSPLYYPDLSAGCSEHGLYLSDSDESVDSSCMLHTGFIAVCYNMH